jgi:hypothetical protein
VKPYVKRQKNDAADAEAICEAVTRANMRFVETKTAEQQSCLTLHRTRHLFIRQQTSVINVIRAHLAEFGIAAPVGRNGIEELLHVVADPNDKRVPEITRACVAALGAQLHRLREQILVFDRMIMAWHRSSATSKRLDEIPGVGPGLATALVAMQDNPQALLPNTQLPVVPLPGSRPLSNARHEHYCRLRSLLCPKGQALREAGMRAVKNHDAVSNATRLERRQDVRDRIAFLVRQEEEVLAEKRKRIEEMLWAIHEADIGDLWETYEAARVGKDGKAEIDEAGRMLTLRNQRPKLLSDLPPDLRKAIEHVQVDARGKVVPQLYSKLQANAELRKMLNIGGQKDRPETDVSRLSDAELIQQLADQAKQLGVEINLNYSFLQPEEPEES